MKRDIAIEFVPIGTKLLQSYTVIACGHPRAIETFSSSIHYIVVKGEEQEPKKTFNILVRYPKSDTEYCIDLNSGDVDPIIIEIAKRSGVALVLYTRDTTGVLVPLTVYTIQGPMTMKHEYVAAFTGLPLRIAKMSGMFDDSHWRISKELKQYNLTLIFDAAITKVAHDGKGVDEQSIIVRFKTLEPLRQEALIELSKRYCLNLDVCEVTLSKDTVENVKKVAEYSVDNQV